MYVLIAHKSIIFPFHGPHSEVVAFKCIVLLLLYAFPVALMSRDSFEICSRAQETTSVHETHVQLYFVHSPAAYKQGS